MRKYIKKNGNKRKLSSLGYNPKKDFSSFLLLCIYLNKCIFIFYMLYIRNFYFSFKGDYGSKLFLPFTLFLLLMIGASLTKLSHLLWGGSKVPQISLLRVVHLFKGSYILFLPEGMVIISFKNNYNSQNMQI